MDVKLLLLMSCVIVANCQSTTSNRNDVTNECELSEDIKSEMEPIRQLLMNLQQATVHNEAHSMKEMKSDVEEIREIMLKHHGNETQAMQEMKYKTEEIRQIMIKQHGIETQAMREIKSQTEGIRQIVIKQHGNETQAMQEIKSHTEGIRQIVIKQHGNETQAMQEIKFQTEGIRQIVIKQHVNETQVMQEMKSKIEEIRQAVIQLQNRPRKGCPPGFDYLPEAGSFFALISEPMNWDNATERCRQVMPGMHLAVITSQEENNAITRYLQLQFNRGIRCEKIWISGQTRNPRQCGDPYVWKPLRGIEIPFNYTNWYPKDPDCHEDRENCVEITTGRTYTWNDFRCDSAYCAICELHV